MERFFTPRVFGIPPPSFSVGVWRTPTLEDRPVSPAHLAELGAGLVGPGAQRHLPVPLVPTPSLAEKLGSVARRKAVCRRLDPNSFAYLKKTGPRVKSLTHRLIDTSAASGIHQALSPSNPGAATSPSPSFPVYR